MNGVQVDNDKSSHHSYKSQKVACFLQLEYTVCVGGLYGQREQCTEYYTLTCYSDGAGGGGNNNNNWGNNGEGENSEGGGSGGGSAGGNPVFDSCYDTGTCNEDCGTNANFDVNAGVCLCNFPYKPNANGDCIECINGYTKDANGNCLDDQIFNELTGKVLCVYNKLQNLSTSFKNMIQKFDGDFPVSHLKLTINNSLGLSEYGITIPPSNYVTEIQLNGNRLSNLSDLGVATTLAHELIHAEIFRKMLSAAKRGDLNTTNMTQQEAENYVNSLKDNFPGLYDYYLERWHPTWNHNMMASHYRTTIADIIQGFDNNNLSRSTYESIAWAGLGEIENNQSTVAWQKLTSASKQTVTDILNQYFFNGTSNCN